MKQVLKSFIIKIKAMPKFRLPRKQKKELKKFLIKEGSATKKDKFSFIN